MSLFMKSRSSFYVALAILDFCVVSPLLGKEGVRGVVLKVLWSPPGLLFGKEGEKDLFYLISNDAARSPHPTLIQNNMITCKLGGPTSISIYSLFYVVLTMM